MNEILMSVCVPTYNGAKTIKKCLKSIFDMRRGYEDCVEVIVSDNASEDETFAIIQEYDEINYKIYQNEINIGFNGNLCKLIDEYAKGKFIWTIGDDDLISCQSIKLFLKYAPYMDILLLKNEMLIEDKKDVLSKERRLQAEKMTYYEGVDSIANGSNILATFMTCAIFKRDTIKEIDKSNIKYSDWSTYPQIFPNGYLLNLGFHDSTRVYCAEDVFIYNISNEREWAKKMLYIQTKVLPEFYLELCADKEVRRKLKKTKKLLIRGLIKCVILSKDFKYKKNAVISLKKLLKGGERILNVNRDKWKKID